MNEELHSRLVRAADDDNRPLPVQPADLLARAREDRKRYRVRVAGASGALAIGAAGAVIAATAVLPSGSDGSDSGIAPAGPSSGKVEPNQPDGAQVPVDLGPLDEQQKQAILTICGAFGSQYGGYDVELARKYDRMDGPSGVVVIRTNDGRIMDCTARLDTLVGGQATEGIENPDPSSLPTNIPEPDAEHSLVSFDPFSGDGHRAITDPKGSYFEASGVFLAADSVDRVEVRVGTPDGTEPWRVAEVRNGLVFWTAWAEPGTLDNDDDVWVSWRAYDKQGNLIDPDLLPYPKQRVDPTS